MDTYNYLVSFMYKGQKNTVIVSSFKDLEKAGEWQEDLAQSAIEWFFKNFQIEDRLSCVTDVELYKCNLIFKKESLMWQPLGHNVKEDGEIEPIYTYLTPTIHE